MVSTRYSFADCPQLPVAAIPFAYIIALIAVRPYGSSKGVKAFFIVNDFLMNLFQGLFILSVAYVVKAHYVGSYVFSFDPSGDNSCVPSAVGADRHCYSLRNALGTATSAAKGATAMVSLEIVLILLSLVRSCCVCCTWLYFGSLMALFSRYARDLQMLTPCLARRKRRSIELSERKEEVPQWKPIAEVPAWANEHLQLEDEATPPTAAARDIRASSPGPQRPRRDYQGNVATPRSDDSPDRSPLPPPGMRLSSQSDEDDGSDSSPAQLRAPPPPPPPPANSLRPVSSQRSPPSSLPSPDAGLERAGDPLSSTLQHRADTETEDEGRREHVRRGSFRPVSPRRQAREADAGSGGGAKPEVAAPKGPGPVVSAQPSADPARRRRKKKRSKKPVQTSESESDVGYWAPAAQFPPGAGAGAGGYGGEAGGYGYGPPLGGFSGGFGGGFGGGGYGGPGAVPYGGGSSGGYAMHSRGGVPPRGMMRQPPGMGYGPGGPQYRPATAGGLLSGIEGGGTGSRTDDLLSSLTGSPAPPPYGHMAGPGYETGGFASPGIPRTNSKGSLRSHLSSKSNKLYQQPTPDMGAYATRRY